MPRGNGHWFEFNGINSYNMGVRIMSAHVFSRGEELGDIKNSSGRDGFIWIPKSALKQFEMKYTCRVAQSRLRRCIAWLRGDGGLRFSFEPRYQYDARLIKQIDYKCVVNGSDPIYEFTATFTAQPFAYIYPEEPAITISSSGATIFNPGTYWSQPRVKIVGQGQFSISFTEGDNVSTMTFQNVPSGTNKGIIVDCKSLDAYDITGANPKNECVVYGNKFFTIFPGLNTVTWSASGSSNSVTSIEILPRWRSL